MQLKQYQSQELKDLLELKLKQNISEILALETKVDSWQKQRKEILVIYRGKLVYGDSIIPNNQEFAKNLGDRLQPNLINAALTVATGKLNNPKSVRELMQILVKFRVFKWENIEAYIYDRVLAIIDKFNSYPGEVQWHDSEDFDLCFGQDGHGLNWTKLKQDLNNRQQQ
jgi:twitching motility two-component system response regulator PilG